MKKLFARLLLLGTATLVFPLPVMAEVYSSWQMPFVLTAQNTSVRFEVDSTWHLVTGNVKKLSGRASLSNPEDPNSITAKIQIPVADIDTGWGLRDDSFYESMAVEKFASIVFTSERLEGCSPADFAKASSCEGVLIGELAIRDVVKAVSIPVKIELADATFTVTGTYTFPWKPFNIDDPSMMMAKVKDNVSVIFQTTIPAVTKAAPNAKSGAKE